MRDTLGIAIVFSVTLLVLQAFQVACSDDDTFITQSIQQDTIVVYPHLPPPNCPDTVFANRCNGLAKQLIELRAELKECQNDD
ncbi:hypothetical protein KAR91_33880 [Candidatus Pacearchaeota archaeon]|nr:hypothetical protein [Candidatus Pacearchaeota archaeon]